MSDRNPPVPKTGGRGMTLLLARVILGVVFVWMGLAKTGVLKEASNRHDGFHRVAVRIGVENSLLTPPDFLRLANEYHMVPAAGWRLLNLTVAVLPWVEVLCGVLLIAGVALRGTALALIVMLVFFTGIVTLRALDIYQSDEVASFCDIKFDCGCGAGEEYICAKVPKNLGLTLLALVVLFARSRTLCLCRDVVPIRPAPPAPTARSS